MKPYIDTLGAGPDLVLLHGWAMHGGIFGPLIEALVGRFRLHVVDLPGHGHSRELERLELGATAQAIAAATPRAVWLGWSLGGSVALHAALAHAPRVRGLCLITASPRFVRGPDWAHGVSPEVLHGFATELGTSYREVIDRFLALETLGTSQSQVELRGLRRHVFERGEPSLAALQDGLRVLEAVDLRARLGELAMPSLWLGARRDRLVPAAAMRWAASQAPRARYEEINASHAPFISHAATIAAAIEQFTGGLAA